VNACSNGGECVLGGGENLQFRVDRRHKELHVLVLANLQEPRDEILIEAVRCPEGSISAVTGGAKFWLHIDGEHAH
jgi:hypothetical protein